MAYEKKNGDFVLFVNDRKRDDNDADFTGSMHWDGVDYNVYVKKKVSKAGNNFLAGNIGKPIQKKEQSSGGWSGSQRPTPSPKKMTTEVPEDEIPF
jgi:hypothetical protein